MQRMNLSHGVAPHAGQQWRHASAGNFPVVAWRGDPDLLAGDADHATPEDGSTLLHVAARTNDAVRELR
jgi:hypothetical protein